MTENFSDHGNSAADLAVELTIAWLSNNNTRASVEDVSGFLRAMHGEVTSLNDATSGRTSGAAQPEHSPAVSVRKSLASRDHIISMIDGKPYKTLRRHLSRHGLTPEQYRERYNLKSDYPMVAESYSESRRSMAQKIGLGRKKRDAATGGEGAEKTAAPRGRRPRKESAEA